MNILHLEASAGWGGQEIRILREAEGMRQKGHKVVLAVMHKGRLIQKGREAGFTVFSLNFKKKAWLWSLLRLLYWIRVHKIDLINTHSSLDAWLGGIAARLSGRPVVRTRHLSTPIKAGLNGLIIYGKLADFVVTTCAAILPSIANHAKQSIPTGVDPNRISFLNDETCALREKLGLKPDDFLIGTACFMRSWKGISDLLQAADRLRDQPRFKWVIIGGGHEKTYREQARQLNLEKIVFFTGHLESPFAAIAALDVFALLSTAHEGVSQAILQAAYLQKPLIATPTGGLCEVCLDQVTGIQVPPFSPLNVAAAVKKLAENPELCRRMGQAARARVEQQFTLKQTLEQMEQVYTQVLQRKALNR